MNLPKPFVVTDFYTRDLRGRPDRPWKDKRMYSVRVDEQLARSQATTLVRRLEAEGYFHYRNYKNDNASARRVNVHDRSRWGLKKVFEDGTKESRDIRVIPIEEVFDGRDHKFCLPRWMVINHYEDDYRYILDNIDLKILVSSAAMACPVNHEFNVLSPEWSEAIGRIFESIDKHESGILDLDEVCLSLLPLEKFYDYD